MAGTSLNPDDIRAAAQAHRELGPDYESAVVESFLEKVTKEIDARVDARLASSLLQAQAQSQLPVVRQQRERSPFTLAVVSLIAAIPLTAISLGDGARSSATLLVVWLGIAVVNVAYAMSSRRPPGQR